MNINKVINKIDDIIDNKMNELNLDYTRKENYSLNVINGKKNSEVYLSYSTSDNDLLVNLNLKDNKYLDYSCKVVPKQLLSINNNFKGDNEKELNELNDLANNISDLLNNYNYDEVNKSIDELKNKASKVINDSKDKVTELLSSFDTNETKEKVNKLINNIKGSFRNKSGDSEDNSDGKAIILDNYEDQDDIIDLTDKYKYADFVYSKYDKENHKIFVKHYGTGVPIFYKANDEGSLSTVVLNKGYLGQYDFYKNKFIIRDIDNDRTEEYDLLSIILIDNNDNETILNKDDILNLFS